LFFTGLALTGSHFAPPCDLRTEFCQPDPVALADEAPEHLPRGPAPPPPAYVLKVAAFDEQHRINGVLPCAMTGTSRGDHNDRR
jgi:hypothetical protein